MKYDCLRVHKLLSEDIYYYDYFEYIIFSIPSKVISPS